MRKRRVVVTGVGPVSPIGIGRDAFWKSLLAGRSGISEVTSFDTSNFSTHRGGEVRDFHPEQFLSPTRLPKYNRASCFAIAGTKMALNDAGLDLSDVPLERTGVVLGTTMAEAQVLESIDTDWVKYDAQHIRPRLIRQYPGNMLGAHVARELNCSGPNIVITTACSAGNYALAYASDLLRLGRADVMIAGGTDAFSRVAFLGFNRLFAIAPDRCQPFDKNRKGMMVSEGSGILVLERYESAIARRAPIYAEILGYAVNCDANHMTIPDPHSISRVMRKALDDSKIEPREVNYVSAHGTGTPANDRTECAAIRYVFGSRTDRLPVSSIKSMIGHAMGAASALEAIACALAVKHGHMPPTINYETPDPECAVDCVPNISRPTTVNIALNNSFAFGGNNACVVFGKVH